MSLLERLRNFLPQFVRDSSLPPIEVKPASRGVVGLVAIVKNEGANIEEWLQFHQRVGFQRFYIYDNGSIDDTRQQLRKFSANAELTVIPWMNYVPGNNQNGSYNHALAQFGADNEWMAFIDLDEFLFPLEDAPIGKVLERYLGLPSVSVPWVMYGSSGHETRPPGKITENFLMRAPFPPPRHKNTLLNYKSIVQPCYVEWMTTHFPKIRDEPYHFYTEHKVRLHKSNFINPKYATSDVFRLNHYYSKSRGEMQAKLARGHFSGLRRHWRMSDRALMIDEETVRDDIILRKWLTANTGG